MGVGGHLKNFKCRHDNAGPWCGRTAKARRAGECTIFCVRRLACHLSLISLSLANPLTSYCFFLLLFFLWGVSLKKPKAPSFHIGSGWNLIGMSFKQVRIDWGVRFWYDVIRWRWDAWRHFTQKGAAILWVHTQRLSGASAVASVRQFQYFVLLALRQTAAFP